ncbi:MAG: putative membrane protein YphA (DoxX/SURF4 family) [Ascidiaceihabitans sp.]|jgi:uncharacterized membrane protein YphA (DoxX/SURF4 family)
MPTKKRISRNTPTLDLSAVKYIRVILATYIMAVGLSLLNGFDVNAYFASFLSHPLSLYVGKVFITFCALMLFFGYFLRLVSLCLAIVILASSVQYNLVMPIEGSIDAFWNDVVLICGILACYFPLSAHQLRKQALIKIGPMTGGAKLGGSRKVVPRRVSHLNKTLTDILSINEVGQKLSERTSGSEPQDRLADRYDSLRPKQEKSNDEVINIFA